MIENYKKDEDIEINDYKTFLNKNEQKSKMNKKERDLALLSSLKHILLEKNLNIISDFDLSTPKTKNFISVIENLKINANKNLIVVKDVNKM